MRRHWAATSVTFQMRETYGSRLHSLGLLSSKARTSILSTKPPGKLLCWSNVPLTFLIPILKMAKATFSPLAHFTLESTTALSLLQKDLVLYFDFYFHIIRPSRGTQKTFLLLTVPDTKGHSCAQKTPPFSESSSNSQSRVCTSCHLLLLHKHFLHKIQSISLDLGEPRSPPASQLSQKNTITPS